MLGRCAGRLTCGSLWSRSTKSYFTSTVLGLARGRPPPAGRTIETESFPGSHGGAGHCCRPGRRSRKDDIPMRGTHALGGWPRVWRSPLCRRPAVGGGQPLFLPTPSFMASADEE